MWYKPNPKIDDCASEERDLPIICTTETTFTYQKAEGSSLPGWAIGCHQTGPGRLLLDVIYGELHQHVSVMSRHGGLLFYNMETFLQCGWLRGEMLSLNISSRSTKSLSHRAPRLSRMQIPGAHWLLTFSLLCPTTAPPTRPVRRYQTSKQWEGFQTPVIFAAVRSGTVWYFHWRFDAHGIKSPLKTFIIDWCSVQLALQNHKL